MQLRLFGSPVGASASPAMQQAGLEAARISGTYLAEDVDPAGMIGAAERVRSGALDGANITAPHKALALELADAATPLAAELGAGNTWLRLPDGTLLCDNTDVLGFRAMLEAWAPACRGEAVLLGAGGAARAAALVLSRRFERVTVLSREPSDARALAVEIVSTDAAGDAIFAPARWPRSPYTRRRVADVFRTAQVVVNAASLGSAPEEALAHLPWRQLSPQSVLLDLAYAAGPTPFGVAASARGREVFDGAVMLLHQGAASFVRWTGVEPPLHAMRAALAHALKRPEAAIPCIEQLIVRDAAAVRARLRG